MRSYKRTLVAGVAGLAILAAGGIALANHGKVGLWSVTVTISGNNEMAAAMAKLPPDVVARMKAQGVDMSGNSVTSQHCMTMQEVSTDIPHLDQQSTRGCTTANVNQSGHMMSADLVCNGNYKGSGHVEVTYDSDTHYYGEMTSTGTANGHPVSQDIKFEGRWVSASCGGVTH